MLANKVTMEIQIQRKILRLKKEHKKELEKANSYIKSLNKRLFKTIIKYRDLQRKHHILRTVNSQQRKKIEVHELTMKAIGDSLAIEHSNKDIQ